MADDEQKAEAEAAAAAAAGDEEDVKKAWNYPLVRFSEIPEETNIEILDTVTAAVERYVTDPEAACKQIKLEMDRLYDGTWHVIVGESFGFDVTHDSDNILYCYFMGNFGILLWRCS